MDWRLFAASLALSLLGLLALAAVGAWIEL